MEARLPYPDLLDRDTDVPKMQHVALTRDKYACGAPRDPNVEPRRAPRQTFDCVVCLSLWDACGGWDVVL